jgi:hypothetical protein
MDNTRYTFEDGTTVDHIDNGFQFYTPENENGAFYTIGKETIDFQWDDGKDFEAYWENPEFCKWASNHAEFQIA